VIEGLVVRMLVGILEDVGHGDGGGAMLRGRDDCGVTHGTSVAVGVGVGDGDGEGVEAGVGFPVGTGVEMGSSVVRGRGTTLGAWTTIGACTPAAAGGGASWIGAWGVGVAVGALTAAGGVEPPEIPVCVAFPLVRCSRITTPRFLIHPSRCPSRGPSAYPDGGAGGGVLAFAFDGAAVPGGPTTGP
jgi:hypothetical protein